MNITPSNNSHLKESNASSFLPENDDKIADENMSYNLSSQDQVPADWFGALANPLSSPITAPIFSPLL